MNCTQLSFLVSGVEIHPTVEDLAKLVRLRMKKEEKEGRVPFVYLILEQVVRSAGVSDEVGQGVIDLLIYEGQIPAPSIPSRLHYRYTIAKDSGYDSKERQLPRGDR